MARALPRVLLGALVGAALGAAAARAAYSAFTRRPPLGDEKTWTRTNHRGEPITLLEGPAFVAGAGAAAVLAPGLPPRARAAALLAGVGSGALGAYDDLRGAASSKGFKGHLTALARGEVTSGAVKILGIGATGLAAAALVSRGPADTLVNGALIAGSANLANLFDLRPGRAIKVGVLTGAPLLAAALAGGSPQSAALVAVPLGAAAALLPEDLGERAMLGDSGANALGALLGLAAVTRLGRPGRWAVLGTVAALTAASEKVSFTKVIAGNAVLNRIDMLGRRPAEIPAPQAPGSPTP
jgi:UDP-N-acetylmuramyl pentapeptide phosphotransferase/UDP-N-acetylglucosamine-1-phosphate transferase